MLQHCNAVVFQGSSLQLALAAFRVGVSSMQEEWGTKTFGFVALGKRWRDLHGEDSESERLGRSAD
ncbi:hypothetical protein Pcac1_g11135 [Phytophthora cactorum]|nr:hypothetical protein Pcac1_g11135 [Phytophthora cactorum]